MKIFKVFIYPFERIFEFLFDNDAAIKFYGEFAKLNII